MRLAILCADDCSIADNHGQRRLDLASDGQCKVISCGPSRALPQCLGPWPLRLRPDWLPEAASGCPEECHRYPRRSVGCSSVSVYLQSEMPSVEQAALCRKNSEKACVRLFLYAETD